MGWVWRIKESGSIEESGVMVLRVGTASGKATTHLLDTTGPGATVYRMDMGSKPMEMAVRHQVLIDMAHRLFSVRVALTVVSGNVLCSSCVGCSDSN